MHRSVFPLRRLLGRLCLGLVYVATPAHAHTADAQPSRMELVGQVLTHIGHSYVEELDDPALVHGAIKQLVRALLDPHSEFLDPAEFAAAREPSPDDKAGVGIELSQKGGELEIALAADDGPGKRAGIKAQDRLVRVDGQPVKGLPVTTVTQRLEGLVGSPVTLTIERKGLDRPKEFTLVRERARGWNVDGRLLENKVGYARIVSFQDGTDAALCQLLARVRKEAGKGFRGLVLDLRDDPGGLLEEAVKVADRFLEAGTIVTTRGRTGRHVETEVARAPGTEPSYPLVVLVDGRTASASEVVAGALKDHGRALVVGGRTFGKGSVQQLIEFDDGSALKLTTARYYTPRGSSIQGQGIEPDVRAEKPQAERPREDELRRPLRNDAPSPMQPAVDWRRLFSESEIEGKDVPLEVAQRALARWEPFTVKLAQARSGR